MKRFLMHVLPALFSTGLSRLPRLSSIILMPSWPPQTLRKAQWTTKKCMGPVRFRSPTPESYLKVQEGLSAFGGKTHTKLSRLEGGQLGWGRGASETIPEATGKILEGQDGLGWWEHLQTAWAGPGWWLFTRVPCVCTYMHALSLFSQNHPEWCASLLFALGLHFSLLKCFAN